MAEDSQADYASVPSGQKRRWATPAQKILFLLVGLNLLGLVVERWFIYNLYEKMNPFNPQESVQQGVATISPVGLNESSEILTAQPSLDRTEPVQQRPLAHLDGAYIMPVGENNRNVLQWKRSGGSSVLSNMGYNNGRLLFQKEGYYYIYSKVTVNAAKKCSLITHKVQRTTINYIGVAVNLMMSKIYLCPKTRVSAQENGVNLWNSFLGGIFQLQIGDEIFVTLENSQIRPGDSENFMGAFMI